MIYTELQVPWCTGCVNFIVIHYVIFQTEFQMCCYVLYWQKSCKRYCCVCAAVLLVYLVMSPVVFAHRNSVNLHTTCRLAVSTCVLSTVHAPSARSKSHGI